MSAIESSAVLDVVPGTIHLVDIQTEQRDGHHHIELVPTPSSDPEDPLNWTPKRKLLAMIMVSVYTVGVGLPCTLQYSVLADITRDTGISTASLVQGTGLMFLFLGWGCLIWQPIALIYGRRGVYILSALLCVPLMVWTSYSRSTGEWYAHRILLGLAASPIESLPEVSIPDVHFAHDRGMWMAIYVFSLFASNFVAPVVAGWLALAIGWRWTMNFGAIWVAVTALILFLGMEETMYFRNSLEGTSPSTSDQVSKEGKDITTTTVDSQMKGGSETQGSSIEIPSAEAPLPRKGYLQKLKVFTRSASYRPTTAQMMRMAYLPLILLVKFPNVIWAGMLYGVNLSLYQVLNATASPILSAPPYNWSSGLVGTVYVGPIIGAALGSLWSGKIADAFTLYLARRNGGVREAEHRLWPLVISSVLSAAGLILWGVGAAHNVHWVGLVFGLGILVFSVVTGGSIALSYNVDCFKEISGPSTTTVIIIRNTMGFAVSYGITPWYTNMGLTNCFVMAGILSMACTLSFLLMIWKGKAMRKHCARKYWIYAADSSAFHF